MKISKGNAEEIWPGSDSLNLHPKCDLTMPLLEPLPLTMFTPHSGFFRNYQPRNTFTSLAYRFRQRIARKRKPLWETEKPGAGSQAGRRSVLGSLGGKVEGWSSAVGCCRLSGQQTWDVAALHPPGLVTFLSTTFAQKDLRAREFEREQGLGYGGDWILDCPIVWGNTFSSSCSTGRQVSIVRLGGSGSFLAFLAGMVLRAARWTRLKILRVNTVYSFLRREGWSSFWGPSL